MRGSVERPENTQAWQKARSARRGPLFEDMGRKSDYTPEWGEKICEQVMDGLSIAKIAAMPGMPHKRTILRWIAGNKDFEQQFFAAKRVLMPEKAHELNEITLEAIEFAKTADPKEVNVNAVVHAMNNRAQHIKWEMQTMWRERYGDKVQAEVSGPNGKPIEAAITVQFVRPGAPEK